MDSVAVSWINFYFVALKLGFDLFSDVFCSYIDRNELGPICAQI